MQYMTGEGCGTCAGSVGTTNAIVLKDACNLVICVCLLHDLVSREMRPVVITYDITQEVGHL